MSSLFKAYAKNRLFTRTLLVLLTLAPLIILIVTVARFGVDVPFWDQWNFVPLLGKSMEWGVSLEDLWRLHNEHRLFFPRLIMLGLAHLSAYSINYEVALILLLAVGIFLLVLVQLREALKDLKVTGFVWVIPVLSLLAFSLHQGENWVWGWQIQIFLNILAVVAGFMFLFRPRLAWPSLAASLVCGIVATYSYANGLTYWIIGFLGLLLVPSVGKNKKRAMLSVWALVTGLVLFSYFFRFRPVIPSGKPMLYFVSHPFEYAGYVFKYLGAAIINYQGYALVLGLTGVAIFFWLCWTVVYKKAASLSALRPFVLIGLYSIACALLTGVGRVGFGAEQAMSHRYVTFSNLLWYSNFIFFYLWLKDYLGSGGYQRRRRISLVICLVLVLSVLFLIGRTSYRVGHRALKSNHDRLLPARHELLRGDNDELLRRLYIDPDFVREGIETLKRHHLSVFRESKSSERTD